MFKLSYYQNYTLWIPTKFFTPMPTTKYASWVVQNTENESNTWWTAAILKNCDITTVVYPVFD